MTDVHLRPATPSDRAALQQMLELYQHDLSDIWDQDLDESGLYGYSLDRYWSDPNCHPFVFTVGGALAGFALVDDAVKVAPSGHWMDQFFVLKKYRRHLVGQTAAIQVLDRLPGHWEIGQMTRNKVGKVFWRHVVNCFTEGHFKEHTIDDEWWQGTVLSFDAPERDEDE